MILTSLPLTWNNVGTSIFTISVGPYVVDGSKVVAVAVEEDGSKVVAVAVVVAVIDPPIAGMS